MIIDHVCPILNLWYSCPYLLNLSLTMKFYKKRLIITHEIPPPPTNAKKYLSKVFEQYILKYSSKLGGILLTFSLIGARDEYRIVYDNPMLIGTFLVECTVMDVCNDVVRVVDGYALGVFYVGECKYFQIKEVRQEKGNAELIGDKLA